MLKELTKLANELDKHGYIKYATKIDALIRKLSSEKDLSEILKEIREKNCKKCGGSGWNSDESYSNAERTDPNFSPWKGDCEACSGDGLDKNPIGQKLK